MRTKRRREEHMQYSAFDHCGSHQIHSNSRLRARTAICWRRSKQRIQTRSQTLTSVPCRCMLLHAEPNGPGIPSKLARPAEHHRAATYLTRYLERCIALLYELSLLSWPMLRANGGVISRTILPMPYNKAFQIQNVRPGNRRVMNHYNPSTHAELRYTCVNYECDQGDILVH